MKKGKISWAWERKFRVNKIVNTQGKAKSYCEKLSNVLCDFKNLNKYERETFPNDVTGNLSAREKTDLCGKVKICIGKEIPQYTGLDCRHSNSEGRLR